MEEIKDPTFSDKLFDFIFGGMFVSIVWIVIGAFDVSHGKTTGYHWVGLGVVMLIISMFNVVLDSIRRVDKKLNIILENQKKR